jgi:UPF0755 protein
MKKKKSGIGRILTILFLLFLCSSFIALIWVYQSITEDLDQRFGEPAVGLSLVSRLKYSLDLYIHGDQLLVSNALTGDSLIFEIADNETIGQIVFRLQEDALIQDAGLFREYLIYKGYDRYVQIGVFQIDPGMNAIEVANKITNPTPELIQFNILPGWRMEEIAASLPRSGLSINPQEFIRFVKNPPAGWFQNSEINGDSLEGFLGTGEYLFARDVSLNDFVRALTERFEEELTEDFIQAINQKGLSIREVVVLASIVERESVITDEMPLIASVFLNRYAMGMKLDSDPTVQYAVGYNQQQATWWSNPLTSEDLQVNSPYNTYINIGLPPGPICNPGVNALQAVVFPQETNYYFFRAKCDGSGYHNFAQTYEEHLQNGCE